MMQKIVIVGGTSGIGRYLALRYAAEGAVIGVTGRRAELLSSLKMECPDGQRVFTAEMDVSMDDAAQRLLSLVEQMGGMDRLIYCAGYGVNTRDIVVDRELFSVEVNVKGFVKMVDTAFNYFGENRKEGHIATISSIAATKGLGTAACYSASKRFQAQYLEALEQVAGYKHYKIKFTTIQPGFIRTDFIHHKYPMTMDLDYAAKRIFKAISSQRRFKVVDWRWAIVVFVWRLIPRGLWVKLKIIRDGNN